MDDALGLAWLAEREQAALSLSAGCARVARLALLLGLRGLSELLHHEADVLLGEAAVCRGEALRSGVDSLAGVPIDEGTHVIMVVRRGLWRREDNVDDG